MKNEKNAWKSIAVIAIVLAVLAIAMAGTAEAKSLYLIAEHHKGYFDAYNINPDGTVTYQATYSLMYASNPGGVAIDEDSVTLFITSEGSADVELVDATTMTSLGSVTAPGASDLAGIDVDSTSSIVYTVNRGTDDLYAYDWDPIAKKLAPKSGYPVDLPNCQGAWGIAVDETRSILYVADSVAGMIRGYDVNTWTEVQTFAPSQPPCDIAVDRQRGYIYTSAPDGSCAWAIGGSNLLLKIDIATGTETSVYLGHGGMGVAVDEVTGYVYVTGGCAGDDLSVWDVTISPFTQVQTTGGIGNPAGLCIPKTEVVYNPLNLSKDDGVTGCVNPGDSITYTICYDNMRNPDVHGVTITDNLPPETRYVSATGGGTYDASTHTVTWDIGTLPAGTSQQCVQLKVQVDSSTAPGTTITNKATIYSVETGVTTLGEDTTVCGGPTPCIPCVSIEVDVNINNNNGKIPYWPWSVFRYNVSVTNNQAYKPGKSRIAITYGLIDDPTSHTLIIGTRMPDIYLNDTYSFSGDFMVPNDVYSGKYIFFASAFDLETGCCGCNAVPFSVEMPSWTSTTSKEESWENWLEIVEG
ncbi:MAG: hypothetical protein N2V78_07445 [Methanophagales archaeon]|nr:hypothetical protein [Methanophagales archaeon]